MNHSIRIPRKLQSQLDLEGEIWKPIPDYEGVYEASNLGRVRRIETGLILSPGHDRNGYQTLALCMNGNKQQYSVHYLVASAFLGKRPKGMVINHINNDPSNNRAVNLEYTTKKGNIHHALLQGRLGKYGVTKEIVEQIYALLTQSDPLLSYSEVAELVGVSVRVVNSINNKKSILAQSLGYGEKKNVTPNGVRGQKLSPEAVVEIKKLLADGNMKQYEIAKMFNVHESAVSYIKKGTYYTKHLNKRQPKGGAK
jgi:predicted XRE-type DNA-binding protein